MGKILLSLGFPLQPFRHFESSQSSFNFAELPPLRSDFWFHLVLTSPVHFSWDSSWLLGAWPHQIMCISPSIYVRFSFHTLCLKTSPLWCAWAWIFVTAQFDPVLESPFPQRGQHRRAHIPSQCSANSRNVHRNLVFHRFLFIVIFINDVPLIQVGELPQFCG